MKWYGMMRRRNRGAFDEEEIIEIHTINQTDSQFVKASLGEKKSKGRKPNRV